MASIITHPAIPLGFRLAFGRDAVSNRLLLSGVIASVFPDLDSIGYWLGVPYESLLGHRGLSHSLIVAMLAGAAAAYAAPYLRATRGIAFAVVFVSMASHGLLDAFSTGGEGIAFFSPFSNERHFLPWQRIRVSPIGVREFISKRGVVVLASEWKYVWLPILLASLAVYRIRSRGSARPRLEGVPNLD